MGTEESWAGPPSLVTCYCSHTQEEHLRFQRSQLLPPGLVFFLGNWGTSFFFLLGLFQFLEFLHVGIVDFPLKEARGDVSALLAEKQRGKRTNVLQPSAPESRLLKMRSAGAHPSWKPLRGMPLN